MKRYIKTYEAWLDNEDEKKMMIPTDLDRAIQIEKEKGAEELQERERIRDQQVFRFFSREYDIKEAWKMIEENPAKYKAPDGTFWTFDPSSLEKWFSVMTPEDRESMKQGKTISIRMGVHVDWDKSMALSPEALDEPGIWINEGKDFSILIDGWHRAFSNYKKGNKEMKIWVISDPKDIKRISI
jgi:hypothetical protein